MFQLKVIGYSGKTVALIDSLLSERKRNLLPGLYGQIMRAAGSVVLNLSEGSGRFGCDKRNFYRIAYGSLKECQAGILLLIQCGKICQSECELVLNRLDRMGGVIWKLVHGK